MLSNNFHSCVLQCIHVDKPTVESVYKRPIHSFFIEMLALFVQPYYQAEVCKSASFSYWENLHSQRDHLKQDEDKIVEYDN